MSNAVTAQFSSTPQIMHPDPWANNNNSDLYPLETKLNGLMSYDIEEVRASNVREYKQGFQGLFSAETYQSKTVVLSCFIYI